MMSKKEINSVLSNLGYSNIKMSDGSSHGNGKVFKNVHGKAVKGLSGGSRGPMTVTNAHHDHNRKASDKIIKAFEYKSKVTNQLSNFLCIDVDMEGSKNRRLEFRLDTYPTYSRDVDLDPGYQSFYWVGTFTDIKK